MVRLVWSSWAAQRTENAGTDPWVLPWVAPKVMANQSKKTWDLDILYQCSKGKVRGSRLG